MDIESRLQRIEAQVHQTKTLVWVVLALVLALGLGLLLIADRLGFLQVRTLVIYVELTLVRFVLIAMVCLLVFYLLASVMSGLRQFRTSREANAQIQDKTLREITAERTENQGRDPGL